MTRVARDVRVFSADMSALLGVALAASSGCAQPEVGTEQQTSRPSVAAPVTSAPASGSTVSLSRAKPGEIVAFHADTIPSRSYFKDFVIEQEDLEQILSEWDEVCKEHWIHGYSHIAMEDRNGTITLTDGTLIHWMVKPGGLATLTAANKQAFLAMAPGICSLLACPFPRVLSR